MQKPATLDPADIEARLTTTLPGWRLDNNALVKTFAFVDFVASLRFVNALGAAAESAQHHPDLDIRYSKVKVSLSTHDANGVTEKDFALAREADTLAASF